MNIIGVICEFNPFHNGHLYFLNKIKERYPDSLIILVLNGYFLQRGEISLIPKFDKTKIALEYGVDIVLELPTLFGSQSADTFACMSVSILNQMHVDKIIFGSERNDVDDLIKLAKLSIEKHEDDNIKKYLDEGCNYPTALAKALGIKEKILSNDLLGISYIKAILKINDKIIPEVIQRTNDYLDKTSNNDIVSASNIREKLNNNIDINKYVPQGITSYIKKIDNDLLFNLIKTLIINNQHLDNILDVDEGMDNRLRDVIFKVNNIDDLVESLKTKRYTYNKIRRMLVHILLNIEKKDAKLELDYLHILGFNQKGKNYLNKNKIHFVVNKTSKVYQIEIKSVIIYDMLTNLNETKKELSNKPIY